MSLQQCRSKKWGWIAKGVTWVGGNLCAIYANAATPALGLPILPSDVPGALSASENTLAVIDKLRDAYSQVSGAAKVKELLQKSNLNSFNLDQQLSTGGFESTKFQHYYGGLEVIGSQVMYHTNASAGMAAGNEVTESVARFDLNTQPGVSEESILALARAEAPEQAFLGAPELKILPSPDGDSARLVYILSVDDTEDTAGRDLYFDAHSGELIADLSHHQTIAGVDVHSADRQGILLDPTAMKKASPADPSIRNACQVVKLNLQTGQGEPIMINPDACPLVAVNGRPGPGADMSAKYATRNAVAVLTYYLQHQGVNSYDNKGSKIVEIVHIGKSFDNAFWDTQKNIMSYGDGDGKVTGDFSKALDVAGHEMTHGVISRTAKLLGMGESGALNEGFADIMGKFIANDGDWAMGRAVFLDAAHAPGVRNLANPGSMTFKMPRLTRQGLRPVITVANVPYPSNLSQMIPMARQCGSANDSCWVHKNATIPGHGAYLVTQAIGKDKAEKIYYAAMIRLSPTSTIKSHAQIVRMACSHLYDGGTCASVDQALQSIGL